ncbi:MAG: winged helix-turn-helix domain-containing protein [Bacteroidota bacterium]
MASQKRELLRIRNHTILVDTNELEIRGQKHKLSPKEMDVLVLLVHHRGRTLSRAELLEQVWGDQFGNDLGLTQVISKLRQILGDTDRAIIRTIPKKGYQLVSAPKTPQKAVSPLVLALIVVGLLLSGLMIYKPIGIRIEVQEAGEAPSSLTPLQGEDPEIGGNILGYKSRMRD